MRSVAIAATAVTVLVGTASPAAAVTWPVDPPLATGMANPGLLHTDKGWVNMTTGGSRQAGHIHTASSLAGDWTSTGKPLLTRVPNWMSTENRGIWAPSITRATDGSYRVYYAGLVKGESHSRCIGTAHGTDPRGPFVPFDRALSCYSGSGARAHDTIPKEGPGFTLIDATPAQVGNQLVLTYKTGRKASDGRWHTTTRLVRLDPDQPQRTLPNPVHASGQSIKITNSWHKYIEENPVLIKRGDRYTLFTSFGWYGTCDYHTKYRQNSSLWHNWLDKPRRDLSFPSGTNTCGDGNAHVTRGLPDGSWRIMFNGHPDRDTSGGPDGLYAGVVKWTGTGQPYVSALLR